MHITRTDRTTASPEKIWNIWTDVKNWKKWDPFFKEAKINGGFEQNSTGTVVHDGGALPTVFKVTKCIPYFTYTVTVRLFFLAEVHIHRFLGYNNKKTTFTHEFWVDGPLGGIWWSMFGNKLKKIMSDEMDGLKMIAEN